MTEYRIEKCTLANGDVVYLPQWKMFNDGRWLAMGFDGDYKTLEAARERIKEHTAKQIVCREIVEDNQ